MKFRNRFLKYCSIQKSDIFTAGAYYAPTMYCNVDGDDDNNDGGDDDNNDNNNDNNNDDKPVTLSADQFKQLIGNQKTKTKEKDPFDKIEDERTKEKSDAETAQETRKVVAFDMSFDSFIDKNKKSFTIETQKFRDSAKGLEGKELERTLSVTAAKDFFRDDDNISLLPERDRDYVKTKIIGLADNAIDYRKAFQLIEDALHVKNRISENGHYRKNSSSSDLDNSETPNVTAYLQKVADAGKPKAPA